jgi:uncharacterized PurR-regulated membrane protein YhhQ (DUF165 family)
MKRWGIYRPHGALALYVACVPLANWMMTAVGIDTGDGPRLLPVGFGLTAPSGVLAIGLALGLRDVVHEAFGWRVVASAIAVGTVISGLVASPSIAIASAVAYALGEVADLIVYEPLRRRQQRIVGILVSGLVGAIVDSVVFLLIAFGSLEYVTGQVVGKIEATIALAILAWGWTRAVSVRRDQ